jgi:hypothetical protein
VFAALTFVLLWPFWRILIARREKVTTDRAQARTTGDPEGSPAVSQQELRQDGRTLDEVEPVRRH